MCEYIVIGIKQETPATSTLALTLQDGTLPRYIPGQYVTVFFPGSAYAQGKAYSISSAPGEKKLTITVHAIGEFSNRLCALKPGNTILASLPQGIFYHERTGADLVMLAGGIGVTPFRSIVFNTVHQSSSLNLFLFYSSPTLEETLFADDFDMIARQYRNVHIKRFVTRESLSAALTLVRRITPELILRSIHNATRAEFLISGPVSFVREQRSGLITAGVSKEQIHTEVCF